MSKTSIYLLATALALTALVLPVTQGAREQPQGVLAQPQMPAFDMDPLPPELEDPAFDRHIDWRAVGRAYAAFDPVQLTEVACQLRAAERVLHRSHRVVSAEYLFSDAVEAAGRKRDLAVLARLEEAAQAWGREDLQARAAAARLAATSRAVPRAPEISLEGLAPQVVALIRGLQVGIDSATLLGDQEALQEYQHRIRVSDQLPSRAREALFKAGTTALDTVPVKSSPTSQALRSLTAASRDLTPADYVSGRTSWLHPHGYFEEIDRKVWVERQNTTTHRLRESARTRLYVELVDSRRHVSVRLYNMKAVWRPTAEKSWRPLCTGHWEDPALVPLNEMKLPDIHGAVELTARRDFPHLGKRFEVLGPATRRYNCIAWSLNVTDKWVWPGNRVSDFDRLNGQHGYHRSAGLDFRRHAFQDKIVLYGKKHSGGVEATHQARQLADGSWSSKLGALPLIRHLKPEDIDGAVYGLPEAVYVRQHGH